MPPRTIGLYALATMEGEGSVHGYRLAQRIAERTSGAWKPGPGAIYPSLRSLVDRGLATSRGAGRRRVYRITPAGRALLRRVRARYGATGPGAPDLTPLWAEVCGSGDVDAFLLLRLRRSLDAVSAALAPAPSSGGRRPGTSSLREDVTKELVFRLGQLRRRGGRRVPVVGARAGDDRP